MVRKIYGRSLSFPVPSPTWPGPKIKGRGSTSLPIRFHPFIAPVQDQIQSLLTWQTRPDRPDPAWILDGLAHLDRLHSALDDLLQHPRAHEQLRRWSTWTDRVLDDFLQFADAYGSLRPAIAELRDRFAATQAAIWRGDGGRIAASLRAQRRAEKEVRRIAAAAAKGGVGKWGAAWAELGEEEAELLQALRDVAEATAAATVAAFGGVAVVSAEATAGREARGCLMMMKSGCVVGPMLMRLGSMKGGEEEEGEKKGEEEEAEMRWRKMAVERLEVAAACMVEVEKGCEKVLRWLVNSRVFLLNTLTPSIGRSS